MTFKTNETHRTSVRLTEPMRSAIDAARGDDESQNDFITRGIERELASRGIEPRDSDYPKPTDPDLKDAYVELIHYCERRNVKRVTLETAESRLHTQQIPKDSVVDELIHPLKVRGWVAVKPHVKRVYIYPRKVNETE